MSRSLRVFRFLPGFLTRNVGSVFAHRDSCVSPDFIAPRLDLSLRFARFVRLISFQLRSHHDIWIPAVSVQTQSRLSGHLLRGEGTLQPAVVTARSLKHPAGTPLASTQSLLASTFLLVAPP